MPRDTCLHPRACYACLSGAVIRASPLLHARASPLLSRLPLRCVLRVPLRCFHSRPAAIAVGAFTRSPLVLFGCFLSRPAAIALPIFEPSPYTRGQLRSPSPSCCDHLPHYPDGMDYHWWSSLDGLAYLRDALCGQCIASPCVVNAFLRECVACATPCVVFCVVNCDALCGQLRDALCGQRIAALRERRTEGGGGRERERKWFRV